MYKKRPQVCKIHLVLNRGCFEAILMKNTLRTLGVKIYNYCKIKKPKIKRTSKKSSFLYELFPT
jgi:hypothetical protein